MINSTSRQRLPFGSGKVGSRSTFASPENVWPGVLTALLVAIVFYLPNQAQFRIETGLRGMNVINVLAILALMAKALCSMKPSEPLPLKWPLWLLAGVLMWSLVIALLGDSTAWVEDVTVFKNAMFYPLLYLLFFYAVRSMRLVRILLMVSVFVLFTSGVLGVRQALDYGIGSFNELKRVAAPFGWDLFDANRAAIFFCIYMQFVGAGALFLKSKPLLRMTCGALFLVSVFVVFHTYSRQAFAIMAVLAVFLAVRKHLLVALLAVFMLYHYDVWVPDTVVERIQMTTKDPFDVELSAPLPRFDPLSELDKPFQAPANAGANEEDKADLVDKAMQSFDGSTESRFVLWSGAWELIQSRPLGIGLNRFKREIGAHVPLDLAGKDAHNVYVLVATEASLLAPMVLLLLLGVLAREGLRLAAIEGDDEAQALGNGLALATLAVVMGNLYGSRFFDGDVMGNYWILAALVSRTLLIKRQELSQKKLVAARRGVGRRGAGEVRARAARPVGRVSP